MRCGWRRGIHLSRKFLGQLSIFLLSTTDYTKPAGGKVIKTFHLEQAEGERESSDETTLPQSLISSFFPYSSGPPRSQFITAISTPSRKEGKNRRPPWKLLPQFGQLVRQRRSTITRMQNCRVRRYTVGSGSFLSWNAGCSCNLT